LFNSELLCSCVNYYVNINYNKKKSAGSSIKINISSDKYFKHKSLEDKKNHSKLQVMQSNEVQKKIILKSYIIFISNLSFYLKYSGSITEYKAQDSSNSLQYFVKWRIL